jgi:hypothetical protein
MGTGQRGKIRALGMVVGIERVPHRLRRAQSRASSTSEAISLPAHAFGIGFGLSNRPRLIFKTAVPRTFARTSPEAPYGVYFVKDDDFLPLVASMAFLWLLSGQIGKDAPGSVI